LCYVERASPELRRKILGAQESPYFVRASALVVSAWGENEIYFAHLYRSCILRFILYADCVGTTGIPLAFGEDFGHEIKWLNFLPQREYN